MEYGVWSLEPEMVNVAKVFQARPWTIHVRFLVFAI